MSDELPAGRARSGDPAILGAQSKPLRIRERSFAYALRAVKLYRYLQKQGDGAGWVLGKQYLRAACSIGANVEEAQAGESRADFAHKLAIAQKEARESLYWLRLLDESKTVPTGRLAPLIEATQEITRILASIILTTKRTKPRAAGKREAS